MEGPWEADPAAEFGRRLGKTMKQLGQTTGPNGCPEIWELGNGDIGIIGRDLTPSYASRLPDGVTLRSDERFVVIPRGLLASASDEISAL